MNYENFVMVFRKHAGQWYSYDDAVSVFCAATGASHSERFIKRLYGFCKKARLDNRFDAVNLRGAGGWHFCYVGGTDAKV